MTGDVRDKIIAWATEEDYEVHVETPPKEVPLEWILRITSKMPIQANVIVQKPRGKNFLVVSMGVVLSEEHYRGLSSMKSDERAEAVYGIIRDLQAICPDCAIIVQPGLADFQRLLATKTLYPETLNRETFMTTIRVMVNILALLSIRLTTLFGGLPAGSQAKRKGPDETLGFI